MNAIENTTASSQTTAEQRQRRNSAEAGSLELLSYSKSARRLGCSRSIVAWLVDNHRLPVVQLTPTCQRIPLWALERFVRNEEGV